MRLLSFLLFVIGAAAIGFGSWQMFGETGDKSTDPGSGMAEPIVEAVVQMPAPEPIVVEAVPEAGAETGDESDMTAILETPLPELPVRSEGLDVAGETAEGGERAVTIAAMPAPRAPVEEAVDSVVSRLKEVPIAYETPEKARMGQVFNVTLAIDRTGDDTASDSLPGRETVVEATARVSERVSAKLSGSGFEIEALSPDPQTLSPLETNTWRWEVKAVDAGSLDLNMEVYALLEGEALPIRTYRNTVTVEVSNIQRVIQIASSANPLFVLLGGIGSLLAGFAGLARLFRPA